MRAVERDMYRRGSVACLERMRSNSVRIEAFADWQRETSEGVGCRGVVDGNEDERTAAPRQASKRTTEGVRAVNRISVKRE